MCGRYGRWSRRQRIAELLGIEPSGLDDFPDLYNITPEGSAAYLEAVRQTVQAGTPTANYAERRLGGLARAAVVGITGPRWPLIVARLAVWLAASPAEARRDNALIHRGPGSARL
jgi:hypothetical protein